MLRLVRYTYQYGESTREVTMLVTGLDDEGQPMGYQVWPVSDENLVSTEWFVDDEATVLVHPILTSEITAQIKRVST